MFSKQQRKIKRISEFVAILSKYGFKDILARMNIGAPAAAEPIVADSEYSRIRKVLEELGPTFIKLGQTLSNRDDLLPKALIEELQRLQDRVEVLPMNIHEVLEDNFGPDYKDSFQHIHTEALAAASIAQIYRAVLSGGEQVVLKVKHPSVEHAIETDLLLMKDVARVLTQYFEFAEKINLMQAFSAFEKSLLAELSFVNERKNIERLAQNFKGDANAYVPKVYPYLSNNEVLCMEFIDGAKITDSGYHDRHGLDVRQLAQNGLDIYLKQILEHGFFHADPHAGNIMTLSDGRIAFIDLGAMGEIYQSDRVILEDLILHLAAQNPAKLVEILKRMALRMDVPDERKLHNDIADVLNMVNTSSLEDLKITVLLDKFKEILFENKIIMPDYFMLLVRGIILIESVGRTLNPDINIVKSMEPYIAGVLQKRFSPDYLYRQGIAKLSELGDDLQNVPVEMRQILKKLHDGNLSVQVKNDETRQLNATVEKGLANLAMAVVLSALLLSLTLLLVSNTRLTLSAWSVPAVLVLCCSVVLSGLLAIRLLRR